MKIREAIITSVITACVAGVSASAQSFSYTNSEFVEQGDAANLAAEDAYNAGTKALNERQWELAVEKFDHVAHTKSSRASGALYWMAYALNKEGKRGTALAAIAELRHEHPQSKWMKEANTLEIEMRGSSGSKADPEELPDDDLKIAALNSLMNNGDDRDQDRATELLGKLLKGNSSQRVKKHALFVLAQSDSPKAQQLLAEVAKGQAGGPGGHDLQIEAIHQMGVEGSENNLDILMEVYRSSSDYRVKKDILNSLGVAGDTQRLVSIAEKEKEAQLQDAAIKALGVAGAQDELRALYKKLDTVEAKKSVLEAFIIAGDDKGFQEVARTEQNPELRKKAIEGLGISGEQEELHKLYRESNSKDTKLAVLHALIIAGDGDGFEEIARSEKDPELRHKAIEGIGISGGSKAGSQLAAIYEANGDRETRREVLNALFISGESKALVNLAKKEKDPVMKRAIIEKLALMDNRGAKDYMLEILDEE